MHLLEYYDGDDHVNVGVGQDIAISDLANLVATATGFDGQISWDRTMPDGTPRKLLDVRRLTGLGWSSRIGLREGILRTYQWYLDNVDHA